MENLVVVVTIKQSDDEIIAISTKDLKELGCPICGNKTGKVACKCNGTTLWQCDSPQCNKICCVLGHGISKSVIGIRQGEILVYPVLHPHPLRPKVEK